MGRESSLGTLSALQDDWPDDQVRAFMMTAERHQWPEYVQDFFSKQKKGLLGARSVPITDLIRWNPKPPKRPLLTNVPENIHHRAFQVSQNSLNFLVAILFYDF